MRHCELLINGYFIGGPCDQGVGKTLQRSPWDGRAVGTAAEGSLSEAETALAAAVDAFGTWSGTPTAERRALLDRVADMIDERADELAELLVAEIGKPISAAQGEVRRCAITFRLAGLALADWGPEPLDLTADPRGKDYEGDFLRVPRGVILAIVPYNWPLNLAAHKIAPALAVGNTVVLKPSGQAPLSTLTLARIVHEAGCPPGVLNAVHMPAPIAQRLALDPRVAMVSFTGSPEVGWKLKSLLPEKPVTLELGGDASIVLAHDADLDDAIPRLVAAGYAYSGQICISAQHVRVDRRIAAEAIEALAVATHACPFGDPAEPDTVCGPLISTEAAERVVAWIREAVEGGARVLAGAGFGGGEIAAEPGRPTLVRPTLIADVPSGCRLANEEVFGPVLTVSTFDGIDDAISQVNASRFGIHAGVFTGSAETAERCARELQVGGVVINDTTLVRFDSMPYGGVKRSGFGREGVRFAMEEMSEPKVRLRRIGRELS
ncbi:MAG: aldehyde dehydrogenase family protein [Fimbriimonadaceae bacterium]